MKTTILKNILREGIAIVGRVAQKNLSLPILSSVLLSGEKNFICLKATDLDIGIKWWVLSKVEREGKVACSLRVLQGLIDSLAAEKITLKGEDKKLLIEADDFKGQINCMDADEFPIIPDIEAKTNFTISAPMVIEGLSQVVDTASTSLVKPEIAGVYFRFSGNCLKLAATDSFRLSEKTLYLEKKIEEDFSFILPQRVCREVINIFSQEQGELKFYLSNNQVLIELMMAETEHPKIHVFARLIEGGYPDYQGLIPQEFRLKAILSKSDFLQKIKTVSLFSNKINEIKIKSAKQGLEIQGQNPEVGESETFLTGQIEGQVDAEISFNWRFLVDGLNQIKEKDIVFCLSKEDGPVVIRPKDNENFLYLLMPLKI